MNINTSIDNIFTEIVNYNGNFGDPIAEHIDFDPLEVLQNGTSEYQVGAGIGLLVNFVSHIDNSTYEGALKREAALKIRSAIKQGLCSDHNTLFKAFSSALTSEASLYESLNKVYSEYVLPNT